LGGVRRNQGRFKGNVIQIIITRNITKKVNGELLLFGGKKNWQRGDGNKTPQNAPCTEKGARSSSMNLVTQDRSGERQPRASWEDRWVSFPEGVGRRDKGRHVITRRKSNETSQHPIYIQNAKWAKKRQTKARKDVNRTHQCQKTLGGGSGAHKSK